MKKIILFSTVGAAALYLQSKVVRQPGSVWVKSKGAQSLLLATAIIGGAYLLVK